MSERQMIDEAVEAAGGNYRLGLEALQLRLMETQTAQGYTTVAAQRRCRIAWPVIFTAQGTAPR